MIWIHNIKIKYKIIILTTIGGLGGFLYMMVHFEARSLTHRSAEIAKEIKVLIEDSIEKITFGSKTANQSGDTF